MSDERFLQFPLFMLQDLFIDRKKNINEIISYGIFRYSKYVNHELIDVASQLMYCFYRKKGDLTNDLLKLIQEYICEKKIDIDEKNNSFCHSKFMPITEIEDILKLFKIDADFKTKAIEFYQIQQAYSFFGINGDFDKCLKLGKEIEKIIPANEPYPSINKNLLFEFRDGNKTEFDLMQFACYIAVRSILGKKSYCRTNKEMILCRAFGYASKKHLPDTFNPIIQELFNKYLKRYHIDRILQSLQINWNILIYSHNMRGLYIGLSKKITLENMILQAEIKKKKNQIDKLKKRKQEAKAKALQQLYKEQ